ncbi:MAG: hypothetical protein LAN63_17595 [Acidobacteriia bacterium]|nr:hypothetical protein [Terriglobia bacterium]
MIPSLRQQFNTNFTPEKYQRFLALMDQRCGTPVKFRMCETPCFFPKPLIDQMAQYGRELIQQLNTLEYRKASLNVFLAAADGRVSMRVTDDGIGFRVEEALARPGSHGLAGMRERVALAGGELDISSAPGRGTRVSATVPFSATAPASGGKSAKARGPHHARQES